MCINSRMNERYRNLEASIKREALPSAGWPGLIPKDVVTQGKETFLYLIYWGLSLLLFILIYAAA